MGIQQITHKGIQYEVNYDNDFIELVVQETKTFFEARLLAQLQERVRSFESVVDIGANVGNHSYFFSKVCGAKTIIAFEPNQANYDIYKRNNPEATIHLMALSNYKGKANFVNHSPSNSGTGRLSDGDGDVTVSTLDDFKLTNVTFMKIDVEGEEVKVLQGALNTIKTHQPDIMVEVHRGVAIEDIMQYVPNYKIEAKGLGDNR